MENQRRREYKELKLREDEERQKDMLEKNRQRNLKRKREEGRKDMFRSKKPAKRVFDQQSKINEDEEEDRKYFE